jgi:hypothetical protein
MTVATQHHVPRPVIPPLAHTPKPGPRQPFVFTDWAMI